jgi:hypothetical protein
LSTQAPSQARTQKGLPYGCLAPQPGLMTEAGGATTLTDNQGEPTTLAPRTRGPSRVFAVPIFAMLPGEQCAGGQSGKVWYLAGTVGSGSVTRTCTVPTSRALFFPITGDVADVFGQEQPPKPPQSPAVRGSLVVKSGDPPSPPR